MSICYDGNACEKSPSNYSDGTCHLSKLSHQGAPNIVEKGWRCSDEFKKTEKRAGKGIDPLEKYQAFAESILTVADQHIMTELSRSDIKADTINYLKNPNHFLGINNGIDPRFSTWQRAQNYHSCPQEKASSYKQSSLPISEAPFDPPPYVSYASSKSVTTPTATLQTECTKVTPVAPHRVSTTHGKPPQLSLESSTAICKDLCAAVPLDHFRTRPFIPLGTPDDWKQLSEFNTFIRAECLEVIVATAEDVRSRQKSQQIQIGQVGIRCRFCAHLAHEERRNGSSVFPSKISTIYQRVTMMVKDHFPRCLEMPSDVRVSYITLKGQKTKGRGDVQRSRQYWDESALRIGIKDGASRGLFIDPM